MEKLKFSIQKPNIESDFQQEHNNKYRKAEKERRGIFDRVYRSRTARILAVAAALGIGGKFFLDKQEKFHKPVTRYELIDKNILDIGNLEKKFFKKIEIESPQNRYILHIGQLHGSDNVEETESGFKKYGKKIKDLEQIQKNIEELLLLISDKYGVKDVFIEGLDKDTLNFFDQLKKEITEAPLTDRWDYLIQLYYFAKNEKENLTQSQRAHILYLVKIKLSGEIKILEKNIEINNKKPESLPSEYSTLFKTCHKNNVTIDKMRDNLVDLEYEISDHELIRGERIYMWGGAMKAYLEDLISVHPAETLEANREAFAKYSNEEFTVTQTQINKPQELEKMRKLIEERIRFNERGNNIREDAAITQITQSPEFELRQIIPLVYGDGHDFKDNIEKINKKSKNNLGLIKITPLEN
jgi:hypothetical protein